MLIRPAKLEDAPALIELIDQLGYKITLSSLYENIEVYLRDPDRFLLVSEIEGRVVGCIASDMAQTFHREGKSMRVVSLVVDRMHQKKGIGIRLLEKAEELARINGCWVIELTSSFSRQKQGVHDFYVNRGYLKEGSQYFHKLLN